VVDLGNVEFLSLDIRDRVFQPEAAAFFTDSHNLGPSYLYRTQHNLGQLVIPLTVHPIMERILCSHITRLYKPCPPSFGFCLSFLTSHYPTPVFRPTTKANSFICSGTNTWNVTLMPILSWFVSTYCVLRVSHY